VTVSGIRIRDYSQLCEAVARRRQALGLTQIEADDVCSVQPGYMGKLEAGCRHFGPLSLSGVLDGLGLDIYVAPRSAVAPVIEKSNSCGLVKHARQSSGGTTP
jgi:hypothetical protein